MLQVELSQSWLLLLQSTASDASLVALLAAKAKAMAGRSREDAERLMAYSSDQVHSFSFLDKAYPSMYLLFCTLSQDIARLTLVTSLSEISISRSVLWKATKV